MHHDDVVISLLFKKSVDEIAAVTPIQLSLGFRSLAMMTILADSAAWKREKPQAQTDGTIIFLYHQNSIA